MWTPVESPWYPYIAERTSSLRAITGNLVSGVDARGGGIDSLSEAWAPTSSDFRTRPHPAGPPRR